MAALDSIKRAPKWAWFIVGGVGLGAIGVRLWNGRDADDETEIVGEGGTIGDPGWQTPGGGASGVIVPPVIIPAQGDPLAGVGELQSLYLGAVDSLIGEWGEVYGPIAGLLPSLIPTPGEYMSLIQGGAQIARETPIVVAAPVPQAAPAPAPAPAPAAAPPAAPRRTRRCEKYYNGESNNCRQQTTDHYSNGHVAVIADRKIYDRPCHQPRTECQNF